MKMDPQKLIHERKMVAEAAAAGFCIPPSEKRQSLYLEEMTYGRCNGPKALDIRKLVDEQQALEQAEASGFCVPRSVPPKQLNKQYQEWGTHVRRDTYGANHRRPTAADYWRGSGDAPAGRSTTVSRSNEEDDDEEDEVEEEREICHRNESDDSFLIRSPYESEPAKNEVRDLLVSQPSVNGQSTLRSASHRTFRTGLLSRTSTREMEKTPSDPSVKTPLKYDKANSPSSTKIFIYVLLFGLFLFLLGELLFQKYGRKPQLSKRARSSLLRLIVDDIIYFVTRHFTTEKLVLE